MIPRGDEYHGSEISFSSVATTQLCPLPSPFQTSPKASYPSSSSSNKLSAQERTCQPLCFGVIVSRRTCSNYAFNFFCNRYKKGGRLGKGRWGWRRGGGGGWSFSVSHVRTEKEWRVGGDEGGGGRERETKCR